MKEKEQEFEYFTTDGTIEVPPRNFKLPILTFEERELRDKELAPFWGDAYISKENNDVYIFHPSNKWLRVVDNI